MKATAHDALPERTLKFPVVRHRPEKIAMGPTVHASSVVPLKVVMPAAVTALTPAALTTGKASVGRSEEPRPSALQRKRASPKLCARARVFPNSTSGRARPMPVRACALARRSSRAPRPVPRACP